MAWTMSGHWCCLNGERERKLQLDSGCINNDSLSSREESITRRGGLKVRSQRENAIRVVQDHK